MDAYRSIKWKKFREEVIRLDGYVCVQCGKGMADGVVLQVHHTCYIRGRKPWDYPHDYCETLCKGCHAAEHGKIIPRYGWDLIAHDDLGDLSGNCDLCGKDLRYLFMIAHPKWPTMEVGESCCDNLTSTQSAGAHMDSVRRFIGRQKRFISSPRWITSIERTWRIQQRKIELVIEQYGDRYKLRMNGILGKQVFESIFDAKLQAFELIESGVIESYLKNRKNMAR